MEVLIQVVDLSRKEIRTIIFVTVVDIVIWGHHVLCGAQCRKN